MARDSGFAQSTWTWDAPALLLEPREASSFQRLWVAFMVARVGVALLLLALLDAPVAPHQVGDHQDRQEHEVLHGVRPSTTSSTKREPT